MNIQELLEQQVDMWGQLGHPAIVERFVLRNGRVMNPVQWHKKKMKAKECFSNATGLALREPADRYVEGYGLRPMLGLPIHHAWVAHRIGPEADDSVALDPTWDHPETCQYMGVEFEDKLLCEELSRLKHYGILDTYRGINVDLIWKLDPELKEITHSIVAQRKIEAFK